MGGDGRVDELMLLKSVTRGDGRAAPLSFTATVKLILAVCQSVSCESFMRGALGFQLVTGLSPLQTEAVFLAENWCKSFSGYLRLASFSASLNQYLVSLNAAGISNMN